MIYVVGSLNMDMAAALHKFPKAGETVIADSVLLNLGGKGANQATAVAKLGGDCAMVGKVGEDAFGAQMRENLHAFGVRTDSVTCADGPSGTAMIWVEGGNNRIVVCAGANAKLTEEDVLLGLASAKAGDILLVQLEVPLAAVECALRVARSKGMVTVLNPAPAAPLPASVYENAEIITPNETETEILTGIVPDCEVNIALAVKKFRALGASNVVITLGAQGSAVAVGQEITLIPAYTVDAVDTTAAGDTFVGAVALKLAAGADLPTAAKFAVAASALKITRRGAASAIPTMAEVEEFVKHRKTV